MDTGVFSLRYSCGYRLCALGYTLGNMKRKQHTDAAIKAVQTVFDAAEQIVAAKRAWQRAQRKAERKAHAPAKGKGAAALRPQDKGGRRA